MKNWLFDADSPLIRGLSRMFDCMLLSVLTIICSLPVVTVGAAVSACYDVMIRMVLDRDNGILKPYFKAFGKNFKKGTLIWLVCLVGIVFIGGNFYLLSLEFEVITETIRMVVMIIVLLLTVLMGFVLIYVFPLQARYENTVVTTLKNAFFISIVQFPRSIGLLFVNALMVVMGALVPAVIPLLLFAECSAVFYFTAWNMVGAFIAMGDEDARKKPAGDDDMAETSAEETGISDVSEDKTDESEDKKEENVKEITEDKKEERMEE